MADTDTVTTTENGSTTTQDDAATDDSGLGDAGKKALAAERDARKSAEKAYADSQKSIADLAAKVKAFEDHGKDQSTKDSELIADLKKQLAERDSAIAERDSTLASKELDALRSKVANREGKQVPAGSITGNTEAEMIASADKLLEWRGPVAASTSSARQAGLRSGAGAPPDGSSEKEKAAAALRSLRGSR